MPRQILKRNRSGSGLLMVLVAMAVLGGLLLNLLTGQRQARVIDAKAEHLNRQLQLRSFIREYLDCARTFAVPPAGCASGQVVDTRQADGKILTAASSEGTRYGNFKVRALCNDKDLTFQVAPVKPPRGVSPDWDSLFNNIPVTCGGDCSFSEDFSSFASRAQNWRVFTPGSGPPCTENFAAAPGLLNVACPDDRGVWMVVKSCEPTVDSTIHMEVDYRFNARSDDDEPSGALFQFNSKAFTYLILGGPNSLYNNFGIARQPGYVNLAGPGAVIFSPGPTWFRLVADITPTQISLQVRNKATSAVINNFTTKNNSGAIKGSPVGVICSEMSCSFDNFSVSITNAK